MKRRGFTLIELLAVIVILAIIALIATPIVMNVIEKSKQKSAEASMDQIERAAELYFYNSKVQGEFLQTTFTCTNGTCKSGDKFLEISGKGPESGTIIINQNGEVSMSSMVIDGYMCVKSDKGYSCTKGKSKDVSTTNGVITLKDVDDTLLNDYKIYGNSVKTQDGSSKSVGELVTDQNDPNYGKYQIKIKTSGKNLFDNNKVYGGLIFPDKTYSYKSDNNVGGTIFLKVEPNTTYYYSADVTSLDVGILSINLIYNVVNPIDYVGDNVLVVDKQVFITGGVCGHEKFTTDEYTKMVVISYYRYDYRPLNVQLEEGDVATDYEPYQELTTSIYLDEPLTTNDYIDYKNQELSKNGVITKIDLPSIQLFKGYNNIIVDTNVTPSNMTVNYYNE